MQWSGLVVLLVACSSPSHALSPDASKPESAIDAAIDARADSPLDAPTIHTFSPTCSTTPSVLLATGVRIIGNMARAEDTLYVSAYQADPNTGTISDNALYTIDLTTDIATFSAGAVPVELWPAGDNVYESEAQADGTIWQLRPGLAPVALVQHLPTPTVVTADHDYVYWADSSDTVQRQLLAGGPIETVMSCASATRLVIDDLYIYCSSAEHIMRALKAGGGTVDEVVTMITDYPVTSMIKDGAYLYDVTLDVFPDLLRIDGTTGTLIDKLSTSGRYAGLAASTDYFYIADLNHGLRRIQRTTYADELIVDHYGVLLDPVLWNHDLFYEDQDPQLFGERYVMHCVD